MPTDQLQEAVEAFRSDVFSRTGNIDLSFSLVRSGLRAALPLIEQAIRNEERVKVLGEVKAALFDGGTRKRLKQMFLDEGWMTLTDHSVGNVLSMVDRAALATLEQEGPGTCRGCGWAPGDFHGINCAVGEPNRLIKAADCPDKEEEAPVAEPTRKIAGDDDIRGRLIEEIGRGRQGVVSGTGWTGDLIGSLQDPDHTKADAAERRMVHGVSVVPLADVEAAINRVLPVPDCTQQVVEEGEAEPGERIAAAIRVCRRIENDAHPLACRGNLVAQGEFQTAEHVRELLEQPLPGHEVDRCPTCNGTGPDRVDRDFDSGIMEAECGDEWHDRFLPDPAPQGVSGDEEELVEKIAALIYDATNPGWPPFRSITETSSSAREIQRRFRELAREVVAATQNQSNDTVPSGGVEDAPEEAEGDERESTEEGR